MAANRSRRIPSLRHHKATGQGFVEVAGRRYYLGRPDRAETREKYHRFVAEWLANEGHAPVEASEMTITELLARFWQHARAYPTRSLQTAEELRNGFVSQKQVWFIAGSPN